MIKLDERLSAVASMVREKARVADIGTDHAYLPSWLVLKGISPGGIAADLRKGPLENARQTVIEHGLSDKIELVLSDGLDNIKENSCDDIVLAGMGGNLIADILKRAPWIKSKNINIVAQPMTHAEVLREFFVSEGFSIIEEKTATDGRRLYCVIKAHYTGEKAEHDISYIYTGKLFENSDSITKAYIEKLIFTLEKKYNALTSANKPDTEEIGSIVSEIKRKYEEKFL